jgi:predicted transcriptional regulator
MTQEEAIRRLQRIIVECGDDGEAAQSRLEKVVLEYLDSSGAHDLAEAWRRVNAVCGYY